MIAVYELRCIHVGCIVEEGEVVPLILYAIQQHGTLDTAYEDNLSTNNAQRTLAPTRPSDEHDRHTKTQLAAQTDGITRGDDQKLCSIADRQQAIVRKIRLLIHMQPGRSCRST